MALFLGGIPGCAKQPRAVGPAQIELGRLEEDHQKLLRLVEELLDGPRFEALTLRLKEIQGELDRQGLILVELESILKSPGPADNRLPIGFVGFDDSSADSLTETQSHYTAAAQEFSRGSYEKAIRLFREFIRDNTDHPNADDAQYWLGECYYALGDLNQAVAEYMRVRVLFPDGDRVPAATLKVAYTFIRLGDEQTAMRYLQQLVNEFPDTPEAKMARERLSQFQ